MSETALTEQALMLMEILLEGAALFFTICSAYIIALYYFLGRGPFLLKLVSFIFVTMTLAFLGAVAAGGQMHSISIGQALEDLQARQALSPVGEGVLLRATWGTLDEVILRIMWVFLGGLYLVLIYLTFLHRWPTPETSVKR